MRTNDVGSKIRAHRVANVDLTLAGLENSADESSTKNLGDVLKFQASNEFPAFFLES